MRWGQMMPVARDVADDPVSSAFAWAAIVGIWRQAAESNGLIVDEPNERYKSYRLERDVIEFVVAGDAKWSLRKKAR